MEEGRKAGKFKYLGISECSAETLRRASKVVKVDAVQTEYSPWTMDIEENGVLQACRELGVAVVAYSPLGRGFLTGKYQSPDDFEEGDFRRMTPRFSKENFPKNLEVGKYCGSTIFQNLADTLVILYVNLARQENRRTRQQERLHTRPIHPSVADVSGR